VVVIGITLAYNPTHFVLSQSLQYAPRMLSLAALVYLMVTTALVAGRVALVEDEPCAPIWKRIVRYSMLYELAAGLIATLMIVVNRLWGWEAGLLLVPPLYLAYRFHGFYLMKRNTEAAL
jgi:hypothetical protein